MVSAALLAWALAYAGMVAIVATRRLPRAATSLAPRDVLLVRPCTGTGPGMATLPVCPPGVTLRWIGCVADASDAAWPMVQACAAMLRERGVDALAVETGARGPNRKADQLAIVAARHVRPTEVLVVVDADVDLTTVDLHALLEPLGARADDGRIVGATWSPVIETSTRTLGDRISRALLGGSWHAFALLARIDHRVVVGKVLAIAPHGRERIHPLADLRSYLGEDFEIGRRLAAAGIATIATRACARSLAAGRSLADVVTRWGRWLAVVRAQRPARLAGYPSLLAAAPLLLCAAAVRAPFDAPGAAAVAVITLFARVSVAVLAARASASTRVPLVDALLADVVMLVAFVRALLQRSVRWADHTLVVGADGRLQSPTEQPDDDGGEPRQHPRRETVARDPR